MKKLSLTRGLPGVAAILSCLLGNIGVSDAADYLVRADDKLKIKIFQYPELSGDYTVNSNGIISIPPIGEIPVAGSTASDISTDISNRFIKAGISDKPGAMVEVAQSRPVYILGDVQKPGEYTYRHGVTVLQAIGVAGGWYRPLDPSLLRLDRDVISVRGDIRNLRVRYYHLLAERARLDFELQPKGEMLFPVELRQRAKDDPFVAQLIDDEQLILRIDIDTLNTQLESLAETRGLYDKEIEAVYRQIAANKNQMESVQKELNEVKALQSRGLSPINRQMNLERMRAQLEMTEQGYQTLILRARQNITQIEQKIFDLKNEHQARLGKQLQQTRVELQEVAVKLDTGRNLMVEARSAAPILVSNAADLPEGSSFTVIRMQEGRATTIDAKQDTELLPGDVLEVKKGSVPFDGMRTSVVRSATTPINDLNDSAADDIGAASDRSYGSN